MPHKIAFTLKDAMLGTHHSLQSHLTWLEPTGRQDHVAINMERLEISRREFFISTQSYPVTISLQAMNMAYERGAMEVFRYDDLSFRTALAMALPFSPGLRDTIGNNDEGVAPCFLPHPKGFFEGFAYHRNQSVQDIAKTSYTLGAQSGSVQGESLTTPVRIHLTDFVTVDDQSPDPTRRLHYRMMEFCNDPTNRDILLAGSEEIFAWGNYFKPGISLMNSKIPQELLSAWRTVAKRVAGLPRQYPWKCSASMLIAPPEGLDKLRKKLPNFALPERKISPSIGGDDATQIPPRGQRVGYPQQALHEAEAV